ncbi:MAG: DNA polymerase III subunit alpha [Deltaproteobacteria bacterium]
MLNRCRFIGPDFGTVLPPYERADGRAAPIVLRDEAFAGAGRRYGLPLSAKVTTRLEHELEIIIAKGFAAYFLLVQKIVRRHPRICGRGSGAASLVAYCLGITNVCPVKHDLYFERFLNPGRTDPPDIDIDFAWDERDEVLAAVLSEYGSRAAMVSSHIPFQPRMALRETARAFGLPEAEIGRVTKRLPWLRRAFADEEGLPAHLAALPELREADLAEPWPEIIRLAARLIGIPRHLSVHPGGVVITPRPIAEYVPVERAAKGVPIIQWEKDGAEEAGLVKIDLLGNRSLGVIRDAMANLRENGHHLDEVRWEPEDDPRTQETVAAGRTMGCFYIESPAIRLLQQRAKKGDFEHLVIHSSIIRPAANEFIREYLRRLHGGAWQPLHPLLGEVLAETYGIMVYQEDVSRTAVALAGFSHAEADGLRKVLSKKDRARRLRDYREQFFAGAQARGIDPAAAEALWQMMMSFDGYSFCKPHSASYARVSFQAAYLKTHFPAEFMAAVISNQGGYYRTSAYVSEARRLGLALLSPDVSCSGIRWRGQGKKLRVGLMAVKGLSLRTLEKIVDERQQGKFRSLSDFLRRVRPDEEEGRNLVFAGALDVLHPGRDRAALLWEAARWQHQHRAAGGAMFDEPSPEPPPLPSTPARERYRREFRILGFLCDCHPITLCRGKAMRGAVKAADLHRHRNRPVRFAGWLVTGKTVSTKRGEPMEFLTFEDETGLVETTFFPRVYRRCCHLLEADRPFLLTGRMEEDFGALTLTVISCRRL